MNDLSDREALLAALAWQVELGADEAISDAPVDRFATEAAASPPRLKAPPAPGPREAARRPAPDVGAPAPQGPASDDPAVAAAVAEAEALAAGCDTLEALHAAMAGFDGCALKAGARSCVFADGHPAARVMVIGEAPGRDEDVEGRPFVGRSGQLLDRMLAAIGLDRRAADPDRGAYIANVLPWRPVRNRAPAGDESAAMLPFLRRHIVLADPEFLLLAGGAPARAILGTELGILRLRGRWVRTAEDRLVLPTLHPAYLLRNPSAKRLAWRDLLALRAALDGEPVPEPDAAH